MSYSERFARAGEGATVDSTVDSAAVRLGPNAVAAHRAKLRALFARVRAIEIIRFESAPPELVRDHLQPATREILSAAIVLLGALVDEAEPSGFDDEAPSGAVLVEELTSSYRSEIGDLAFMAQVELRHRSDRLSRMDTAGGILLAECDSALRRVARALSALDRALAGDADDRDMLTFDGDLDVALAIRRAYAGFRRRILLLDATTTGTRDLLLASGREIATLVGMRIYGRLRLSDRIRLRDLQSRLMGVLRVAPLDELDGQRLWSDVVSFASMLALVNRRQELFEHDSQIVIRVVESLSKLGELSPAMARELERLDGRDDDVDALLLTDRRDLDVWAPVLTRLAQELGRCRAEGDR